MRPFATRCVLIGLRVGVRASLNWTVVGAIVACMGFGFEFGMVGLYSCWMEIVGIDRSLM